MQTLEGHEDWVSAIAFSPDDKYLATGSWDAKVRLWDLATGALHSTLRGHGERVHGIAFSPKGQLASASSKDRTVRFWEPVTGVTSRILDIKTLDTKDYIELLFLPNGDLVVQDRHRSVGIWNRQNDSLSDFLLQGFTVHQILAVSSHGRLALKVYRKDSNEAEVLLYDSTTGAMHILDVVNPARIYGAAFSSEERLALGFANGTIMVRDPAKDSYKKLDVHSNSVRALSFSPDGRFLVSGSSDQTLRLWELSTQTQSLIGTHGQEVFSVAFSPDGKRIASIDLDSTTVQIWEPFSRSTIDLQQDNQIMIWRILFSPSGDQIACTSFRDNRIRLYDTATETLKFALIGHSDGVQEMMFSYDGNQIASASMDQSIRLWDPRTGTKRTTLNCGWGHPNRYIAGPVLDFSPDGEQLASGSANHEVCVWDSRTGHLHHRLKGHQKRVSLVRFSPSGKKVASIAEDQTAGLWDTMTGQLLGRFGTDGWPSSMAFSLDGVYFAWQSTDHSIMLYNLETEEPPNTVKGLKSDACALAFSADSVSLASTSKDSGMLWDVETARVIGRFPNHGDLQLSFSSDGTYLKTERGHNPYKKLCNDSSDDLSTHDNQWRCDWQWLMQGDRKILWLPLAFRTGIMAHHDGLFALALHPGEISFFKVNQGEAVTEV